MRNIRSLSELIEALRSDFGSYRGPLWYRGHNNAKWKLVPSLHRLKGGASELDLLDRFRQDAHLLVEQSNKSEFDWLFIMQHYGVPTRLLDWTESPLVGLYFAVNGQEKNVDGSFWILKPLELNKITIAPKNPGYIPSLNNEELSGYTPTSMEKGTMTSLPPAAVIATRNTERIQAQLGVFTISHRLKTPIDKLSAPSETGVKSAPSNHATCYTIPAAAKPTLASDLKLLAFSKFQVFPELSSIGSLLSESLK